MIHPTAKRWMSQCRNDFIEDGVTGINIEEIARRLGITKSSFYYHFGTVRALLKATIEADIKRLSRIMEKGFFSTWEGQDRYLYLSGYYPIRVTNRLRIESSKHDYLFSYYEWFMDLRKSAVRKRFQGKGLNADDDLEFFGIYLEAAASFPEAGETWGDLHKKHNHMLEERIARLKGDHASKRVG